MGDPDLREAIAQYYSPVLGRKIDMNSEVLVSNGASGCLGVAL